MCNDKNEPYLLTSDEVDHRLRNEQHRNCTRHNVAYNKPTWIKQTMDPMQREKDRQTDRQRVRVQRTYEAWRFGVRRRDGVTVLVEALVVWPMQRARGLISAVTSRNPQ